MKQQLIKTTSASLALLLLFLFFTSCAGEQSPLHADLSVFSASDITTTVDENQSYTFTNHLRSNKRIAFGWAIYRNENWEEPFQEIAYSNQRTFTFTPPDSGVYSVRALVLDKALKEEYSCWIENGIFEAPLLDEKTGLPKSSEVAMPQGPLEISKFSSQYLFGGQSPDGAAEVTCTFEATEPLLYAWYIYEAPDKETPIEKTKYAKEATLTYQFPDPEKEYLIKCFVKGETSGEHKSAWVQNWQYNADEVSAPSDKTIQDFSRSFVTIQKDDNDENTYVLTHNFQCNVPFLTAWNVYLAEDKNTVVDKKEYSEDSSFTYTLPDSDQEYAIKAFLKDPSTGDQKSVWVAYFPEEEVEAPEDPIPSFTYHNIQRTVLNDGYEFINNWSEDFSKIGFRIYERVGSEQLLLKTVEGASLRFENRDPNKNYILKAYLKIDDTLEKEIDFYYFYSDEFVNHLIEGIPFLSKLSIEDLLQGNFEGYNIALPLDWSLPQIDDRATRINVQSFRSFAALLERYQSTKDPQIARFFLSYMDSWLDAYPLVPLEEDDTLWSDFAVSFRVRIFSCARILFDSLLSNELVEKLENHLVQCAALLRFPLNYKEKHNHGMYQDFALLGYLNAFGYVEANPQADFQLALARLKNYFDYSISTDGAHREHSPSYHSDILKSVDWLNQYCQFLGNPYAQQLQQLEANMENFYFDLIMPDFTWPPLGDSYRDVLSMEMLADDPRYEWLQTKGKSGTPPKGEMVVYHDGGYAIMRSPWENAPSEATYLLLTAATHSTAHKHQDDLSFILYHKGQLFVEAGKRNYNYDDPETVYAYSSFAHNVLFVDKQGWPMSETHHPILDDAAYQTQLTDYGQSGEEMWATGKSVRWPTVAQERTLRYSRAADSAEVFDLLTATESTQVRLIYHIAEGVDIEQTSSGWELSRDGELVANVSVEASADAALSYLQGSESDGDFKTWLFDQEHLDTPLEGGLLIIDMTCLPGESSLSLNIELQ